MDIYLYILLSVVLLFTLLKLIRANQKVPNISFFWSLVLCVMVIYKIATYPIKIHSDKSVYKYRFENLTIADFSEAKDIGFTFFSYVFKSIIDDSDFYFFVVAFFYVLGYFIFSKKKIIKSYIGYFLLANFLSFGFASYGVNTIRGGLALSLYLIAISFYEKRIWFVLLSLVAVLTHKSILLPFIAFITTKFYSSTKHYYYFWLLCLVISFLNITFVSSIVEAVIGDADTRFYGYLSENTLERYKTGFRIDFLMFSVAPILVGRYYINKLNVKDIFYTRIYNTYLLSNAIWLIVIRMAFTDRMAYLSWFLIPVILLFPLIKYELAINQKKWIAIILLSIYGFTSYMYFK